MVHLGPKKIFDRKSSLTYLPEDVTKTIEYYEKLLTVPKEKLKEIVDHFVSELEKGLSKEGGSIPMNVAWVMDYPTGKEKGSFLALDMGGTNLRVAEVMLDGKRGFDTVQSKFLLPDEIKVSDAEKLWGFIADCVGEFITQYHPDTKEKVMLCFTFSYPCTQTAINRGVLQRWTKGFDISGVEGHDIVPQLQKALDERGVMVQVAAVINDTTGTLVASNYVDPLTEMGCIFGTGCNAAYYERVKNIPKLEGLVPKDISPDSLIAINCEYGAYDNEHVMLPRTKYDVYLDEHSPRPNQQAFEKMIAGYTLGELLRLIMLDLHENKDYFADQDTTKLREEFILDASHLSKIELDPWQNLMDTETMLEEVLGLKTTEPERALIRRVTELLGTRAARLSMCGVAAMTKKRGFEHAHAGADGSVFTKYPHFEARGAQALAEIFDWDMPRAEYPIKVVPAEDGSGVGAAIIAALSAQRLRDRKSMGIIGSDLDFGSASADA